MKKNKIKDSVLILLSPIMSIIMAFIILMYYLSNNGEQLKAMPLPLYYISLAFTLIIITLLALMIIFRKFFDKYDFIIIILSLVVWVASTINYSIMCTSLQFPSDYMLFEKFYGVFMQVRIVKNYGFDMPHIFTKYNVNFELPISILILGVMLFIKNRAKLKANINQ